MKKIALVFVAILIALIVVSCKRDQSEIEKVKDIDYTVLEEADIPKELADIIADKKEKPFKLTFSDKEFTYIAVGYGKQSTGGYCIEINELYMSKNAIVISTTLNGPSEDDMVLKASSYPYVIVKMECIDANVIYNL